MNVYDVSYHIETPGVTYCYFLRFRGGSPLAVRLMVYIFAATCGFKPEQVKINHVLLTEKGV